ncbi:LysR family transcriptional regulator [uncultured Fusobacterium sp.]|uniref:LysR family transcriptional regulator n=1 Tax=uncultured Fusobacterium sp. TaxID=159267 RepID=UPI0027DBDEC0|nr:LysR family transcriptional regulator [uncultured Fusobacterium sp.]
MDRTQLMYVTATAKHGNITKAAEELCISQPSLSNQIIKLENELNIKLFERKRHRVELTEAGRAFVESSLPILNSFGKLEQLMGEYASMNKGSINIGILPIFSALQLPDYLYEFKEKFPKIDMIIKESGSSSLVNSILKKELDVAFTILTDVSLEKLKTELNIIKLQKDRIVAVVEENHRLAGNKSIELKDLANEKLIFSNDNFQFPNIILDYLKLHQIPHQVSCSCTQMETIFTLVSRDFGITFCSEVTAQKELKEKENSKLKLKSIPLLPLSERIIYLISGKNPGYHPTIDNFIRFIREKYNIKTLR